MQKTLFTLIKATWIVLMTSCGMQSNYKNEQGKTSDSITVVQDSLLAKIPIPFLEAIGIKTDSLIREQIPTPTVEYGLTLSSVQAKQLLAHATMNEIKSSSDPAYIVAIKSIGKNWMIAFKTDAETTYGLGYFVIYSPDGKMQDALYIGEWYSGDWEDLDDNHDITRNYEVNTVCKFTSDATFSILSETKSYIYNSIKQTESDRDSCIITYNYKIDSDSRFVFLNRKIDDYGTYKRIQSGQSLVDKCNNEIYYQLNHLPVSDSTRFDKWNNLLYAMGDSIPVDRFFYKEFLGQLYYRNPSQLLMWIYQNRKNEQEVLSTTLHNTTIHREYLKGPFIFSSERIIRDIESLDNVKAKTYLKDLVKDWEKETENNTNIETET